MTTLDRPTVRLAAPADAPAIARIYNQGIEERIATFETEPRTPAEIAARLAEKGDRYPTVVVERHGAVVAWASTGPYRARPAYAGVAEHSVYVERGARGGGAGRAALEGLARKTKRAASGSSSRASSPRIRRASRCTRARGSAWSASTAATAGSRAGGATA